jgi:glycosyltransferase involved in cell wall biosynthesis
MLTFIIPTYNAQEYLVNCLQSIRNQTQPSEILIVDGGSTDLTLKIAEDFKCKILFNPKRLAEYGVQIGMKATETDLVVVFAADNELPYKDWIRDVTKMFEGDMSAVWGKIVGDEKRINIYFELIQNDPLCWFLRLKHCWGANGLVYRTKDIKPIWDVEGYIGDNDAFQTMIEQGKKFTYTFSPFVVHHHCKSIRHCVSKWWRNHTQHYLPNKEKRNMRWLGTHFKLKVCLWVPYVIFLSFPHSLCLVVRDDNLAWLYHFPLSLSQMCVYILAKLRRIK